MCEDKVEYTFITAECMVIAHFVARKKGVSIGPYLKSFIFYLSCTMISDIRSSLNTIALLHVQSLI